MKKHLYYNEKGRVKMITGSKIGIDKEKLSEIHLDMTKADLGKIRKGCTVEIKNKKLVLKHIKVE